MKYASFFFQPPSSVLRLPPFVFRMAFLLSWAVFALFVIRGAASVPFHPDESTHLFMSRDFDVLFSEHDPAALFWTPERETDAALRYRLLDAPLSRYLVGLSRALAGASRAPLNPDWNWSQTWEENLQAGAMPTPNLLFIARLPAALMTALAPLLVFKISQRLGGSGTGVVAALLYGFNSLVLLHGRRAMSEGPMLFTALLAFWWIVREPQRPVLTGLGAALAMAAKLTGAALLAVALFAGAFVSSADTAPSAPPGPRWGFRIRSLGWCLTIFVAITLLLNPVLWASPLSAFQAMGEARQKLHADQTKLTRLIAPNRILHQPGLRLLAMLYHVYFAPLAFWDIPNYADQTRPAERRYLSRPLHHFLRNPDSAADNLVTGGLLFALTLVGMALGIITLFRRRSSETTGLLPTTRHTLILLWVWTVFTMAALSLIDIPVQRYYLPLAPIASIWTAYGLEILLRLLRLRQGG